MKKLYLALILCLITSNCFAGKYDFEKLNMPNLEGFQVEQRHERHDEQEQEIQSQAWFKYICREHKWGYTEIYNKFLGSWMCIKRCQVRKCDKSETHYSKTRGGCW